MESEINELTKENDKLRKAFAIALKDLEDVKQNKLIELLNLIVDVEIELEKFCNI